ncbi:kinase-like domain-containing protein [Xylaria sp. FL1777]|nr:kinase-like domain-containing protein [Xylaria sp. FL1777]
MSYRGSAQGVPVSAGAHDLNDFEQRFADALAAEDAALEDRAHEARAYFDSLPNFQYEDVVGAGAFGVALRVRQIDSAGRSRKLIIKRARHHDRWDELRNEISIMARLNGSAHIARVIAYKEDVEDEVLHRRLRFRLARRLINRIRRRPPHFLAGLAGPTLVLEYLENGSVDRLLEKIQMVNQTIPNRILWSIFLCSAPALEEIKETGPPTANFCHGDMHGGNILFGSTGDFPEHAVIPPAKLIDFGLARQVGAISTPRNLMDVGKAIMWLILGEMVPLEIFPVEHLGIATRGGSLLGDGFSAQHPAIDLELRDLLVRCLADSAWDRPQLAEVLEAGKDAVRRKDAAFYGPLATQESDDAIRRFVQELIYNA